MALDQPGIPLPESTLRMDKVVQALGITGLSKSQVSVTIPGAAWQRCRTHYSANLMCTTPKSSWPWVKGAAAFDL